MRNFVLGLFIAFVFHQAQAGLKLFHNEKRSIFDIIPEGTHVKQSKKLSVKCYKDSPRNCVPAVEAGFKQPPVFLDLNKYETNLKQSLKNSPLKKQIRDLFKARNSKRPNFQTFEELKKELRNHIKITTMTKEGLIRKIPQQRETPPVGLDPCKVN